MKKHRNNLMKRGLAAVLSGMMLLATVMPAMAEEGTPASVVAAESTTTIEQAEPAAVATETVQPAETHVEASDEQSQKGTNETVISSGDATTPSEPGEDATEDPDAVADDSSAQPEENTGATNPDGSEGNDPNSAGEGNNPNSAGEGNNPSSADEGNNPDSTTPETPAPVGEGSQPESTEDPASADETGPKSTIDLLPVDETAPEGTSHTLIEINEEETTTKELSTEPMTLEAHTYNGINVTVDADAGVLPVDTHLSVYEVKSETRREQTAEKLDEAEVSYDDYMVLDISLYDAAFNKIEPESGVRVSITMDAEKLPEEADADTLEVQHLEEDENGEVKDVVQVADNGNVTEGMIEVKEDNTVAADFAVASFSLFTITWARRTGESSVNINFEAYMTDANGRSEISADLMSQIEPKAILDEKNIEELYGINSGRFDYSIKDVMGQRNIPTEYVYNGNLYVFQHAQYDGVSFDAFQHDSDLGGNWTARAGGPNGSLNKNGEPMHGGVLLLRDGSYTGTFIPYGRGDKIVQLYYRQSGDGSTTVVPSLDSDAKGIEMYMFKFSSPNYRNNTWVDGGPGFAGQSPNELYYKMGVGGAQTEKKFGNQYDNTAANLGINVNGTFPKETVNKGNLYMDGKPFDWRIKFARGQVTKGLVSKVVPLGEEYPRVDLGNGVENGASLKEWFDPEGKGAHQKNGSATSVNKLFRQDIYDQTGYFYYSCDENSATLVDKDITAKQTEFVLYDEVITARNAQNQVDANFFYRRGNFLPYNTVDTTALKAYTRLDMSGNPLSSTDPLYNKPVYGYQEPGNMPTYYFGMSLNADFYQPEGGMVENPHVGEKVPMIFEFNGDDDFWLYIDDVLVLDLGGNHDAQSGYINFQTGDVYYTDNGSHGVNGKVNSNISCYEEDYRNIWGEPAKIKYDGHTTLLEIFENALTEQGARDLDTFDGNTFAAGKRHNMKIYYMEHCGGASNLRLTFNIPVEPVGDLKVEKEFTEDDLTYQRIAGGTSEAVIPEDFRAVFSVYAATYNPATGKYEPTEFVDEVELTQETYEQGLFEKVEEEGRVKFVHTFKRLSLGPHYIVDEKIYRSGKGYIDTEFDYEWTYHGQGEESDKEIPAAPKTQSTQVIHTTVSNKTAEDHYDNVFTVKWNGGKMIFKFVPYKKGADGTLERITDNESLLRGTTYFYVNLIEGADNNQAAPPGSSILIKDALKRMGLSEAGNYMFNYADWTDNDLGETAGIRISDDNNSIEVLDKNNNLINRYNKQAKTFEIKLIYDEAVHTHRSDAFRIHGGKGNAAASLKVENKYLTPLSVRKVLRSRMETDPDRDFSFRIYVQNRDSSDYDPAGGLVGTVYEVKTIKDERTGEEREELVEKMVQDENGVQVPDKRYLIGEQDENGSWYFAFNLKRNEEITFGLPKGLKYRVVELVEQGYKVTGMINLKDSVGSNTEIVMNGEEYTEKEVRMKKWMNVDELVLTEETLVTITNTFDIARTGLSMSTVPFILMVVFALLAIGGLAFITIRRRAMNIDD